MTIFSEATRSASTGHDSPRGVAQQPDRITAGTEGVVNDQQAASGSVYAKPPRNQHIELLRVFAIISIAVFHVFLSWFTQAAGLGAHQQQIVDSHAELLAASFPSMWAMGVINLLGSWGNHVFFMISGFFLIPSLAEYSHEFDYWRSQVVPTLKRCLTVVLSVLFYGFIALAVNAWIMPLPGAGSVSWWGMGLEFIWLYLVFVALAPMIAWGIERIGSAKAEILAFAVLAVVYALNAYIAFVAQGDLDGRGLGDWRKQMSAVTYLVSFIFAGLIGKRVRNTSIGGSEPKARQWWRKPRIILWMMIVVCLLTLLLTGVLAASGRYALLYALSFKSTSLIACALAVLALLFCASAQRSIRVAAVFRARVVSALAPGILGFYIAQSLMHALWFAPCYAAMRTMLAHAMGQGAAVQAMWLIAFFAFGIVFALLFAVVVCLFDRFLRQPVLRALRLLR
ncbi:MAG: acyltransferase family protein [Bifidobacterium psychraerophilum]|uniref:acyltransferase family protein n=1 Tax=Bifidobacterium psychraerophilum TaxID=218140 RepID=UPI0039E9F592